VIQHGAFAPLSQVLQKFTQALQHFLMLALVIWVGEFFLSVRKRREPLVSFLHLAGIEKLEALGGWQRAAERAISWLENYTAKTWHVEKRKTRKDILGGSCVDGRIGSSAGNVPAQMQLASKCWHQL